MSDADLRELERAAAGGDPEARWRWRSALVKAGRAMEAGLEPGDIALRDGVPPVQVRIIQRVYPAFDGLEWAFEVVSPSPARTALPNGVLGGGTGLTASERLKLTEPASPGQERKDEEELRARFLELKRLWHRNVGLSSSTTDILSDMNYQEILALGPRVLPLILEDLSNEAGHWFAALQAMTGWTPPLEDNCTFEEARQAWLQWGRDQKFLKDGFRLVLGQVPAPGSTGSRYIHVIKEVRAVTGLGLVEAKRLVDRVAGGATAVVRDRITRSDAEHGRRMLESAGAKASVEKIPEIK